MKKLRAVATDFQQIEVWGSAREVEFRVTGAIHAWWHRQHFLTGMAWDTITAAVLLSASRPPKTMLMLGLGGGTAIRQLRHLLPQLQVTALEHDGGMIALAREWMHLDALDVEVIPGDAYAWLRQNRRRFDVVVDDVYGSGTLDVARPTVYTPELAAALQRALKPQGAFVANLVTGPGHRKMQGAYRKFFTATFPVVRSLVPPDSLNEALVGGRAVLPPSALQGYTDRFTGPDRTFWQGIKSRRLR